jgi:high-affinity iron transporter
VLLAAGLASQSARYLVQADWLPALGQRLWDSTWLLSEQSLPGQMLHVLVGYSARPSGMQVLFYIATVSAFVVGVKMFSAPARLARTAA